MQSAIFLLVGLWQIAGEVIASVGQSHLIETLMFEAVPRKVTHSPDIRKVFPMIGSSACVEENHKICYLHERVYIQFLFTATLFNIVPYQLGLLT